jgi:hypothetical protein
MFSIILVLLSVQASFLPKNDFVEDTILNKFVDALKDEHTIDSWMNILKGMICTFMIYLTDYK